MPRNAKKLASATLAEQGPASALHDRSPNEWLKVHCHLQLTEDE
jgi:hypothetical protein